MLRPSTKSSVISRCSPHCNKIVVFPQTIKELVCFSGQAINLKSREIYMRIEYCVKKEHIKISAPEIRFTKRKMSNGFLFQNNELQLSPPNRR